MIRTVSQFFCYLEELYKVPYIRARLESECEEFKRNSSYTTTQYRIKTDKYLITLVRHRSSPSESEVSYGCHFLNDDKSESVIKSIMDDSKDLKNSTITDNDLKEVIRYIDKVKNKKYIKSIYITDGK